MRLDEVEQFSDPVSDEQKQGVRNDLATGMSVSAIARKFATSRQTIMRVRDEDSRSARP